MGVHQENIDLLPMSLAESKRQAASPREPSTRCSFESILAKRNRNTSRRQQDPGLSKVWVHHLMTLLLLWASCYGAAETWTPLLEIDKAGKEKNRSRSI